VKQLKSKSKLSIDLTVEAPSKKKSKTVKSEDVIVVNPQNPLPTTTTSAHSQSPFNTTLMEMTTFIIHLTNQNAALTSENATLRGHLDEIEARLSQHDSRLKALSFHNNRSEFVEGSSRGHGIPSVVVDQYQENFKEDEENVKENEENQESLNIFCLIVIKSTV